MFFWAKNLLFCYRTPDLVNGLSIALCKMVEFAPLDQYFNLPWWQAVTQPSPPQKLTATLNNLYILWSTWRSKLSLVNKYPNIRICRICRIWKICRICGTIFCGKHSGKWLTITIFDFRGVGFRDDNIEYWVLNLTILALLYSFQCWGGEPVKMNMTHSQMLGKFEYTRGPIFKVVLEC